MSDSTSGEVVVRDVTDEWRRREDVTDDVGPGDSVSQVSHGSRSVTSIGSSGTKAAAVAAGLAATAERLRELQAVQREELEIRQRREAIELGAQLARANAERDVYERAEAASQTSRPLSRQSAEVKVAREHAVLDPDAATWTGRPTGDDRVKLKPELQHPDQTLLELVQRGQQQQQKIVNAMGLPKVELIHFDGDPLKYWLFSQQFDNSVDTNDVDDRVKLLMLFQYCTGNARRAIECCAAMDVNQGYRRARLLLKERFGNEFVISETWVNKVAGGPVIGAHDKKALREMADDLRNCVESLHAMNLLAEVSTQSVLLRIVQRLPFFLRNRWVHEVQNIRKRHKVNPDVRHLVTFVEDAALECNDPVYGRLLDERDNNRGESRSVSHRGRGTAFNVSTKEPYRQRPSPSLSPCSLCSEHHSLFGCQQFKDLDVSQRRKHVVTHHLCFNCLRAGHGARNCGLNRTCSVDGCGRKHTKFLHPVELPLSTSEDTVSTEQAHSMCNTTTEDKIALPVVLVEVRASATGECIVVQALLDSGSTNTFITEELSEQLSLNGERQSLQLTTLDGVANIQTSTVSLEISAVGGSSFAPLHNVFTRKTIPIRQSNIGTRCDVDKWPHLRDLQLPTASKGVVKLLIGQDNPDLLLPREVRLGDPGDPYATRSILGWTINGPLGLPCGDRRGRRHRATSNFIAMDVTLQEQVERFWKVDDWEALLNERPGTSVEDRQAVDIWERTIELKEGHYTLDVPFRSRPPELPYNRDIAETRLHSLKKRLLRNDDMRETYCREMQSLIDKGYAEPVNDARGPVGATWYLPHHPVTHATKGKTRIVFDCAATKNGVSLNDRVLQGPDMTNSLLGVLLRFRQEPVAIMADIEAMFHQVHVTQRDRDALRFLWWPNGDLCRDPQDYRMTVHLFGGNWSPSCCNFALRQTAEDNQLAFTSDAGRRVARDFYVDDCLMSVKCEDDAIAVIADMKQLLERGGFNLTKWISNSRRVLASVPEEDRAREVKGLDLTVEALPVERALGVCWNVDEDTFELRINMPDKPLTRRGLLSVVSSMYDPVGFISPFTLTAKKIIQDLTRKKVAWDEPLPEVELRRWQAWVHDLPIMSRFRIPRCLKPHECNAATYQIHHFSDASETAYGVVSYLRVDQGQDSVNCGMVMAKSRLAPLKTMTIPRLELAAAALAVKVDGALQRELDLKLEKSVFWTDSTIVLCYINNASKRFLTYVANRVAVIHGGSTTDQWRHVPSDLNPADDLSRGLSADDMVHNRRWISGPSFLHDEESKWPASQSVDDMSGDDLEVKKPRQLSAEVYLAEANATEPATDTLIEGYSSWYRLKRGVAMMLRAKRWLRSRVRKLPTNDIRAVLCADELRTAEREIIRYVQGRTLKREITEATENGLETTKLRSSRRSSLYSLRPFLSDDGLLCVGGRLRKANVPDRQKHPLILPKRHHVVELIIKERHEMSGHTGREHVLSLVRQCYWIIAGRQAVRRLLKSCFACKRRHAPPATQKMADLPSCRLQSDHPPFTFVGG